MAIYSFSNAVQQLRARTGHRSDVTDTELTQFINQAQHVMATNIKGLDSFQRILAGVQLAAGPSGYIISAAQPGGLGLSDFWAMEDMLDTTDANNRRRIRRGEWDIDLNIAKKAVGPPTLWHHRGSTIFFNTGNDKLRTLTVIYRRLAVSGTLEIPDEQFEHLLTLASIFLYPSIGRLKDRDALFQRLPVPLQLAVTNPMTPSMWESTCDTGLGVYGETWTHVA